MQLYNYRADDRRFLAERVAEFRDQVARRLSGALSEDEFKPLRLMNGLYLQLHAYMLRVAIPYGTLASHQLRALAEIARRYDRGFGHFTTRQNIQFNWIKLEDTPEILALLASVDMHALQTSGNCIRNVTADHFAGVAADEIEDPRIWCELIRQWSTLHPEFSFLPRKFKIAVTGSPEDRAAVRVHDIGLVMVRDDAGAVGFEVLVGGGQGRTPMIASTIRRFVPKRDLLSYLEAIMRVYNLHGRRDNLFKARIKILVQSLGAEAFARAVDAEFATLQGGLATVDEAAVARIAADFAPPPYRPADPAAPEVKSVAAVEPAFARWTRTNLFAHKVAGHTAVIVSLKPPGGIPGDASADQMDALADLADRFSFGELRVTHGQNLVLPHVRLGEVPELWRALDVHGLATANAGLISDMIACPGLDYCSLANTRSIPIAQRLSRRFSDPDQIDRIGPLEIKISGCINACGHHHVGHIGILGVDKKGDEFYQITLGGRADGARSALGKLLGPAIPSARVIDVVQQIIDTYLAIRCPGEPFADTVARVGVGPFKTATTQERRDEAA